MKDMGKITAKGILIRLRSDSIVPVFQLFFMEVIRSLIFMDPQE